MEPREMTKTSPSFIRSVTLSASLLLASLAQAATPLPTPARLDKALAPIVDAAEQHVEASLMERALVKQSTRSNSPLEARWNASGQVQVYLHYDPNDAAPDLDQLRNLGATDLQQSPELHVIQAWVPAAALKTVSNMPGVTRVSLPRYALFRRAPATAPRAETGSVTTQGDQILGSAKFRSSTGVTGQGITVGVISDGDDHIADSQKTGDLPGNIWNDANDTKGFTPVSSGDEGTAMMEIVYDIAPGVKQLGFCGPQSTVDFITCLDDFQKDISANIIVDDLAFTGAMFSTDDFTKAVQAFSDNNPNIRLITATGNDGTGFWAGTWSSPTPVPVAVTVNSVSYAQALNFGSSANPNPELTFDVQPGDTALYTVEWNDPWDDDTTTNDPNDYDVVLFDSNNNPIACNQGININPNNGSCTFPSPKQALDTPGPQPAQGAQWRNSTNSVATVHLEVFYVGGTPGNNLKVLINSLMSQEIVVTPSTTGSVTGHAALAYPAEISVGAIYAPDAVSRHYDIESYSSTGPVELGVTNGKTQDIQDPQSIMKPDFAAPDCVNITGAGGFPSPFCGTSAAAPHIAGLTALIMSGYPGKSPYTLLQKAATQPGKPSPNGTFGYGVPILTNLLNAGIRPTPPSKGGGGDLDLLSLIALGLSAALARRRCRS